MSSHYGVGLYLKGANTVFTKRPEKSPKNLRGMMSKKISHLFQKRLRQGLG